MNVTPLEEPNFAFCRRPGTAAISRDGDLRDRVRIGTKRIFLTKYVTGQALAAAYF